MRDVVVLSGGGSRGAYQAGFWQAADEAGWHPDLIVGTSIGAVTGAAAAGGLPIPELVAIWKRLRTKDVLGVRAAARLLRGRPAPATGLRSMLEDLDWDRVRGGIPLRVTAVEYETRSPVTWTNQELSEDHLLATTALPPVLAPVAIDGSTYIDGGVWQNPPVEPALGHRIQRLTLVCHDPIPGHAEDPPKGIRGNTFALADVVWHSRVQETLRALEARRALPKRHPLRIEVEEVHVVAPARSIVPDILRFVPDEARAAIAAGHLDGNRFLASLG